MYHKNSSIFVLTLGFTTPPGHVVTGYSSVDCAAGVTASFSYSDSPKTKYNAFAYDPHKTECIVGNVSPFLIYLDNLTTIEKSNNATGAIYIIRNCLPRSKLLLITLPSYHPETQSTIKRHFKTTSRPQLPNDVFIVHLHINYHQCKYSSDTDRCIILGSDLPEDISAFWVFSDDQNFYTGYPKATLISVDIDDFVYGTDGVKSIAPTLTGKWAPYWFSDTKGEIKVKKPMI